MGFPTLGTDQVTVFGKPVLENAYAQLIELMKEERAVKGALMADHHLGYSMPIGGVVAYEDAISPTGVGFDIGCGNAAVRTNIREIEIMDVKPIMREIQRKVEFGIGGSNETPYEHLVLDRAQDIWLELIQAFGSRLHQKASEQLGTVGSGNHYVDLLVDEYGYIWVANHFGSRGLGHTIASGFMAAAQNLPFTERVPEGEAAVLFDTKSPLGEFYIEAMHLAGRYAYAGREFVINQVLEILGAQSTFSVHNHHNYAWKENGLWVVRKGATPLTEGYAFIGGSMGDDSYIVRGKTPEQMTPHLQPGEHDVPAEMGMYDDLYGKVVDLGNIGSAPHGAGRVMSRTMAAGKKRNFYGCPERECDFKVTGYEYGTTKGEKPRCPAHDTALRKFTLDEPGLIDWEADRAALNERGIVVLGAGADEAPGVYKRLNEVLDHHGNIEIAHRLSPIGVVMAGADVRDPYKD